MQWLTNVLQDGSVVSRDLKDVSTAATNIDYTSLSVYSNSLFADSQKAMDDSDLYSVSPDLQGAKDEYRLMMIQANWAAYFSSEGVEDVNKGDVQTATSEFNQAAQSLKSCSEHSDNFGKQIDTYNSKKKNQPA
jgi:hypothetical protein